MQEGIYYELEIKSSCEPQLLAEFVETIYDEGLEIAHDRLILRSSEPLETVSESIKQFCQSVGISIQTQQKVEKNCDWIKSYQDSIQPVCVGNFYIRPSWVAPKSGLENITIDPALSFGSGHHATTASVLLAISKYLQKRQKVLDVGCGSGILSIAAAKMGADVWLCDSDEQAISSAKANFEQNDVSYKQCWVGSVDSVKQKYDLVVANIVADVLVMLQKGIKNALSDGGILILSGILNTKAHEVKQAYSDLECQEVIEKDEWVTLVYRGADEKSK